MTSPLVESPYRTGMRRTGIDTAVRAPMRREDGHGHARTSLYPLATMATTNTATNTTTRSRTRSERPVCPSLLPQSQTIDETLPRRVEAHWLLTTTRVGGLYEMRGPASSRPIA